MAENKRTKKEDAENWERPAREKAEREKVSMPTKDNSGAYDTQEPADEMRAMMGTNKGREKVAKANDMFSMMPSKVNKNASGKSKNTGTPRTARSSQEKTAEKAKQKKTEVKPTDKNDAFENLWRERNGGRRRTRKRRRKRRKTRKSRRRKRTKKGSGTEWLAGHQPREEKSVEEQGKKYIINSNIYKN